MWTDSKKEENAGNEKWKGIMDCLVSITCSTSISSKHKVEAHNN